MKNRVKTAKKAHLVLEDGSEFSGFSFGKARSQAGEVVFSTGHGGYPESLTDPSFRGQILVSTYPLTGNYGVPLNLKKEMLYDKHGIPLHFESSRVQVSGFVLSDLCETPSHYNSGSTLSGWLENENIPGIFGVDTRALTIRLRESGVMRGKILVEGSRDVTLDSGELFNPVEEVSGKEIKIFEPLDTGTKSSYRAGKPVTIALVDCGVKANIIRCLLARNVKVIRVPWDHDLNGIEYDGILVSNGPGDPKKCGKTIAMVRRAFTYGKPIFGICLGNQIMALAAGADTYKLPYGHRGQNQPCAESGTNRCYITSQNHGYAVRDLPRGWEASFINANDGTIEGIRSTKHPFSAIQFHPEGCPGPKDTEFLIDRFIAQTEEAKK